MKVYILIDKENIVRCMASEECNLHTNKPWMKKYFVKRQGTVGDEYSPKTDTWIPRPENYPQSTEEEINNQKIANKIRQMAIDKLIEEGELPPDYKMALMRRK